jgi:hypothetical protein
VKQTTILVIFLALTLTPKLATAMSTDGYFEIRTIYQWTDYTGGVTKVLLKGQDSASNELCRGGYWLEDTSGKHANVLSMLMSAYHTKTKIKVYANENEDWPSLASKECKIKLVVLESH